jgi:hypothetical protein
MFTFITENGEKKHGQGRTIKHDGRQSSPFGTSRIHVGEEKRSEICVSLQLVSVSSCGLS